jgi:dienelactone hydrolase
VAAALVIVFVLDDAFGHPEPGTTAGDHVINGTVPVAAVALAAFAYPRLRPGLRATLALVLGALAIVAGTVDGVAHAAVDRVAGDDVTAILAALAGGVLVGVGAATLWRTRRLDEPRLRRYVRRGIVAAAAVVVAAELLYPVGLGIVATHPLRAPVRAADLGGRSTPVTFRTTDGLRLRGWYVPSHNGAAVIVSPRRREAPAAHARMLVRHGYGVLLFDRRGEGQSEGDGNLFGWEGGKDLLAAIAFVDRQPDVRPGRIGGLGLSVGGEMLLQAAAESPDLRAVVAEGAGTRSLREAMHEPGAGRWLPVGGAAFWTMATTATAVFSNHAPPPDLMDVVRRIGPRPLFFVYAERSAAAGEDLNPRYYAAARGPKELWRVHGAGHTGGLSAQPAAYERRVVGFFDRALLRRTTPRRAGVSAVANRSLSGRATAVDTRASR